MDPMRTILLIPFPDRSHSQHDSENKPRTNPFPDCKPENSNTLELMKQCAKISGMRKPWSRRIHGQNRENRQKQARTENGSQKPGYVNGLSESESPLTPRVAPWLLVQRRVDSTRQRFPPSPGILASKP